MGRNLIINRRYPYLRGVALMFSFFSAAFALEASNCLSRVAAFLDNVFSRCTHLSELSHIIGLFACRAF